MTAHEVRALLLSVMMAADSSRIEVVDCADPGVYLMHLAMGDGVTTSFVLHGPMTTGGVLLEETSDGDQHG
jgi:hypothetical protein